jgi:hypothetical protein
MRVLTYYWVKDDGEIFASCRMSSGRREALEREGCDIYVGYGELPDKHIQSVKEVKIAMDRTLPEKQVPK